MSEHVYIESVSCPKQGCEMPNEVITSRENECTCEHCGETFSLEGLIISRAYVDDEGHPLGWREEEWKGVQPIDTRIWSELQSFDQLRASGVLWLINATVFHPRGMALAIEFDDDGECIGWKLCTDSEAWVFTDTEANIGFDSFEMFISKLTAK